MTLDERLRDLVRILEEVQDISNVSLSLSKRSTWLLTQLLAAKFSWEFHIREMEQEENALRDMETQMKQHDRQFRHAMNQFWPYEYCRETKLLDDQHMERYLEERHRLTNAVLANRKTLVNEIDHALELRGVYPVSIRHVLPGSVAQILLDAFRNFLNADDAHITYNETEPALNDICQEIRRSQRHLIGAPPFI